MMVSFACGAKKQCAFLSILSNKQDTNTHTPLDTHTCSETAYRIIDVECIVRAKTLQLNLTDTVKTVPFRGETERITKMM